MSNTANSRRALDDEAGEDILDCLATAAAIYDAPVHPDSPLHPLMALAARIELEGYAFLKALTSLPAPALALAHRIADPDVVYGKALNARTTDDTDALTYLRSGIDSQSFLVSVFMRDEPAQLPTLHAILLDPDRTASERASAILALHDAAADWISHLFCGGAHPDDTTRFYATGRTPSRLVGQAIVDRQTNVVVRHGLDPAVAAALAATMSAYPAIGEQMAAHSVASVARQGGYALPGIDDAPEDEARYHEHLQLLWLVSRSWRMTHAISDAPWQR